MEIILILITLVLLVVVIVTIVAMVLSLFAGLFSEVPFVPIPGHIAYEALTFLEAKDEGLFYDLGSGDGRVVYMFAKSHPHVMAIGADIGPLPFLISRIRQAFSKTKNARFVFKNFFKIDLSRADYIYMYLFPDINQRLQKKFAQELKKGARVVCIDFPFKDMEPINSKELGTGMSKHTLYLYQF